MQIANLFPSISIIVISVEIVGVLILLDSRLHFIKGLLDEGSVLDVQDAICVALNLRIMRHHYTCRCTVLTLSLRANPVDVQDKVHDCD